MEDITGALGKLQAIFAEKEKVSTDSIKIGDIIKVPLDEEDGIIIKDGYETRDKFIVIVGFTSEGVAVGALLINSKIDRSKQSSEFLDCQYPLKHADYLSILDYDSWLDCSDIFEISKLKITQRDGRLKGQLTDEDKERVTEFLIATDVFDDATKKHFGIIN